MKDYAVMAISTYLTLIAAFAFAYAGQWLAGFVLFTLAVTPVPLALAKRAAAQMATVRRRLR